MRSEGQSERRVERGSHGIRDGFEPNFGAAAILDGVFAACGLLFLLAQRFCRFMHLRLQSLSLDDLLALPRFTDDHTDVIKEFYDWQYTLLLAVIGFRLFEMRGNSQ